MRGGDTVDLEDHSVGGEGTLLIWETIQWEGRGHC